jgi:hypothetical protein
MFFRESISVRLLVFLTPNQEFLNLLQAATLFNSKFLFVLLITHKLEGLDSYNE